MGSNKITYSFEQWCLDNNHQDYLDLWDYELNDKKPSEVSFASSRKCWFKCDIGIHDSELWLMSSVTSKNVTCNIACRRCNSFGQYLLDIYGEDGIKMYWSDRNVSDAFSVRKRSNSRMWLKCPYCGVEKHISCDRFFQNKKVPCSCGDGISYPNKFMHSLLRRLDVEFTSEYSPRWVKSKRYDFYLPNHNLIIEMDGELGHGNKDNRMNGITSQESKEIDDWKDKQAELHNIRVIRIDCLKPNLEYIKNDILKSELPKLLNFKENDVDWNKVGEDSLKNLVKYVCELWNSKKYTLPSEIAQVVGLNRNTICNYLKRGDEVGWCNYSSEKMKKVTSDYARAFVNGKNILAVIKKVGVYKNGKKIHSFDSVAELVRKSVEVFGVKFSNDCVYRVCRGVRPQYRGYFFRYED